MFAGLTRLRGATAWTLAATSVLSTRAEASPRADPRVDLPVVVSADALRYYPDRAQRMRINGWARLRCVAQPNGRLVACQVVGEAPADLGFGLAASRAARLLRVRPDALAAGLDGPAYYLVQFQVPDGSTVPDTVVAPSAAEIEAARPPGADPVGMAALRCEVPPSGQGPVSACEVLAEGPARQGFGGAALDLAARGYRAKLAPTPAKVTISLSAAMLAAGADGVKTAGVVTNLDAKLLLDPGAGAPVDTTALKTSVTLRCGWTAQGRLRGCRAAPAAPAPSREAVRAALAVAPCLRLVREVKFNINWGQ